jgi:hypothetical protein
MAPGEPESMGMSRRSWALGVRVPGGTWGRIKIASVVALGSRSPWGYLRGNKNSLRRGPGESESLGVLGEGIKIASAVALGSHSPWGYLGKDKNSLRCGPGESESLGVLGEEQK